MYLGHALLFPTQYNFENQEKFQVPVFNTVYGEGGRGQAGEVSISVLGYQLYLLTERSMILNDALTGHNSQASFSRNMRSSSILDLWYVLKYFTVCVRMESWRSSDVLPQNSSPTAINLGRRQ